MTRRFLISKIILPAAVAVGVSYLLISQIPIGSIPQTLGRASFSSLVIGFCLYCVFVATKALRFRELLMIDRSLMQLFPILALYTFWGNLLPMRSGDLSYIYLMKRREQVNGAKSVASLMLASLIDLALLIALMIGTGWLRRSHLDGRLSYAALFLAPTLVGVLLLSLIVAACVAPRALVQLTDLCMRPLRRWNHPLVSWLAEKSRAVMLELTQLRFDWRFVAIWVYSMIGLGVRFGFQCYLVGKMGIQVSVVSLVFALAFTHVFNLLPIQSIGNFGTVEAPFAWALVSFGASTESALVSGFSLHLIILLYCLPLGAYGYAYGRWSKA